MFILTFYSLIILFSTNILYVQTSPDLSALGGGDFVGVSDDRGFKILLIMFITSLILLISQKFMRMRKKIFQNNILLIDFFSKKFIRNSTLIIVGLTTKLLVISSVDKYKLKISVVSQWDSINIASWKVFRDQGLSWGVDFWYPYGNLINLNNNGLSTFLLALSPLYCAGLMIHVYRSFGGRKFNFELLLLLISVLLVGEIYFVRYLLIPLTLLYILLMFSKSTNTFFKYFFLFILLALVSFTLTDTFYICFLIFTLMFFVNAIIAQDFKKYFIFYTFSLLPVLSWIAVTGRFNFLYNFLFSNWNYLKSPYSVFGEFTYLKTSIELVTIFLFTICMYLLCYRSLSLYLSNSKTEELINSYYLIFVAIIFSYSLYKTITRFDESYYTVYLTSLLVLPLFASWIDKTSIFRSGFIYNFLIFLLSLSIFLNFLNSDYESRIRFKDYQNIILSDSTKESFYLDFNNLVLNDDSLSRTKSYIGKKSFFILTDYPVLLQSLYIFDPNNVPWVNNIFNMSNKYDKDLILRNLEKSPPELIIFEKDQQTFDGIPNSVRIPEIYSFISKNYTYKSYINNLIILGFNPMDASIAEASRFFGSTIDLGYTQESRAKNESSCNLIIKSKFKHIDVAQNITIELLGQKFVIISVVKSKSTISYIDLSRTWLKSWLQNIDCNNLKYEIVS